MVTELKQKGDTLFLYKNKQILSIIFTTDARALSIMIISLVFETIFVNSNANIMHRTSTTGEQWFTTYILPNKTVFLFCFFLVCIVFRFVQRRFKVNISVAAQTAFGIWLILRC